MGILRPLASLARNRNIRGARWAAWWKVRWYWKFGGGRRARKAHQNQESDAWRIDRDGEWRRAKVAIQAGQGARWESGGSAGNGDGEFSLLLANRKTMREVFVEARTSQEYRGSRQGKRERSRLR